MKLEFETAIRLSQAGDMAAKEQLLNENSGLIWAIAKRYFGKGSEPEDLYQLGCIGFLKAVEGFDFSFGTEFSTYAVPKIAGEIRRFLRDDGAIKVSRTIKEQAATIYAAKSNLAKSLGREPSVSELSEKTGFTPEQIAAAELATAEPESIQKESGEDGFSLECILSTNGMEEKILESLTLKEAISTLPDTERQVISLRFFHGLTQQKAAELLGVSQVQVSRLEKRALGRLKKVLV